jgi:hypothetical protein
MTRHLMIPRWMTRRLTSTLACCALLLPALPALAQQTDPDPAMNNPDQIAWQLFIQVNSRAGGSNAVFETFASDTDTFQPTPQFPTGPTALTLHPPILETTARDAALKSGVLLPAIPPDPNATGGEETRRNRAAFDFIVNNNLFKVSGLQAAFGKTLSFPIDAIEVKANWIAVQNIPQFTNNQVSVAQVSQFYHVNTDKDGNKWALVAMHVISKMVPNWTWATFENRFNPARCDIIGCRDSFGAQTAVVPAQPTRRRGYPDCTKTAALSTMLSRADIEPVYANYCLKGSQTDFVDNSGLDIRLGNSVTEDGFVPTSSCMSCHGRANFDKNGQVTSSAGFINPNVSPPIAPLGALLPSWYFTFSGQPPVYEGMPGLTRTATSADFVWSIPFCAIDDTQNPPQPSNCVGK